MRTVRGNGCYVMHRFGISTSSIHRIIVIPRVQCRGCANNRMLVYANNRAVVPKSSQNRNPHFGEPIPIMQNHPLGADCTGIHLPRSLSRYAAGEAQRCPVSSSHALGRHGRHALLLWIKSKIAKHCSCKQISNGTSRVKQNA